MSAGGRPRRFRLGRGTLLLAAVAPVILAAVGELVWTAVVAFSGSAPPPSSTTTPTATPSEDMSGCPERGWWGKVSEQLKTEGIVVHPTDFRPLPGVTVKFPELGLEAVTDEQGCYSISAPPLDEPRLLTIEFSAPGFGPVTYKNLLCQRGACGYSPTLGRGNVPMVLDLCAFQSPPLSAAMQIRARLCVEAGDAPNYLTLGCPLPGRHQSGPPVASVVGSVVDAATGQPVAGAIVAIQEYQESRVTGEDGCFLFDPLPLPTPEPRTSSVRFATLAVTAPGYRTLILKHLWLEGRAVDVELEAGAEAQTVDYCVFSSPPQEPRERVLAERCREAGVLVLPAK